MDDSANTNIEVNQKAALGGTTTQIGQQNIYNGMSPKEACQMALDLFYQNFPKLQTIAKETAEKRANEFCQEAVQKIVKNGIEDFSPFSDPDVQYTLYEAQKNYARFGTSDMLNTLTSLVAERVEHDKDFILKIAIDKAIEIAPLLTPEQLDYLSILFICTMTKTRNIVTIEDLKRVLESTAEAFSDADFSSTNYLYMLGCLQFMVHFTIPTLAEAYNFKEKQIKKICPPIIEQTTGDYTTSYVGTILAIVNAEAKTKMRFDPKIWIQ